MKDKKKFNLKEFLKAFFKENWKFLIFLVFLYGFMTYELPYAIYTPGGTIDMSKRVEGDNTYDEDGSISMTYVSMVRGSAPFILLSYVIPNWDVVSKEKITYDGDDLKETVKIDKIYMQEAISNAEFVAYEHSKVDYEIKEEHVIVTIVSSESNTSMKSGDEIVSIDGTKYNSLSELQEYIATKSVEDFVEIEYIHNDKNEKETIRLIDVNGNPKVGISMATINDYETDFNIKVKTKSSESGPSGGLMTALEIYNKITENDITKGLKIMGTGTIDRDGTVGEIGGVKYKLLGAIKENADVFICPEENYESAKEVLKSQKSDIILISAKTFEEALQKIEQIQK